MSKMPQIIVQTRITTAYSNFQKAKIRNAVVKWNRGTAGRENEEFLRTADRQACQVHFRLMNRLDIKFIDSQKALKRTHRNHHQTEAKYEHEVKP